MSELQELADQADAITAQLSRISDGKERSKLMAVCGILNAFTLAKQNVTGSPFWKPEDVIGFSNAIRELYFVWRPETPPRVTQTENRK
jgi:hypothetical protein